MLLEVSLYWPPFFSCCLYSFTSPYSPPAIPHSHPGIHSFIHSFVQVSFSPVCFVVFVAVVPGPVSLPRCRPVSLVRVLKQAFSGQKVDILIFCCFLGCQRSRVRWFGALCCSHLCASPSIFFVFFFFLFVCSSLGPLLVDKTPNA